MFDLLNIFKTFLPQLLLYPNAADPLNGEAASLMLKDKKSYAKKVKSMVQKYAKVCYKKFKLIILFDEIGARMISSWRKRVQTKVPLILTWRLRASKTCPISTSTIWMTCEGNVVISESFFIPLVV